MRQPLAFVALVCLCLAAAPVRAGLHYSGEPIAELPSQWRGYLSDLRTLRNIALKPSANTPVSPLRKHYEEEAKRLRDAAKTKKLTAAEAADLGAILLRLNEVDQALEVLRAAQREHPRHHAVLANLGTAWQLYGDLEQAADCLRQAVTLAPAKLRKAEELHLRLVRQRLREERGAAGLDDLFGVQFAGESG